LSSPESLWRYWEWGFFGGEFFEPAFPIAEEAGFVVVDENAGGDVHGVDEDEAFFDAGLGDGGLDVCGDVDEAAAGGDVEPEFFAVGFHGGSSKVYAFCLRRAIDEVIMFGRMEYFAPPATPTRASAPLGVAK
jgi:hypothetical protein